MEFVNLHVHTSLGSMQDSLISVDSLFSTVADMGQSAVAITDHGNMSAIYDGWKAYKRTGLKFIPGCEAYFVHSYEPTEQIINGRKRLVNEKRKHITLLAKNQAGYKSLLKASYEAFKKMETQLGHVFPRLDWNILEENSDGVVCLSGCGGGIIAEKLMLGDMESAKEMAKRLSNIFPGRFYLELQPHHLKNERIDQEWINEGLIEIAKKTTLPLVVTTDAHYLTREEEKYHDMLLAIRSKKALSDDRRMSYGIDEFYLKSGEEIHAFLSEHYGNDVADSAVANTVAIARECENPDYLEPSGHHLPDFPCQGEPDYQEFLEWCGKSKDAEKLEETTAFMRFRCFKGFKEKFSHLSIEEQKKYWNRVRYEVGILEKNKFSSYMLVVSDYIRWSIENDILVGVGRGCLEGDTLVFTDNGFVKLKDVRKGDRVFSHTGSCREVIDTFEYDIDEMLVEIKTDFSFFSNSLTLDHKILGSKAHFTEKVKGFEEYGTYSKSVPWENFGDPEWLRADELRSGDGLFVPWPKRTLPEFLFSIDLSEWAYEYADISDDTIKEWCSYESGKCIRRFIDVDVDLSYFIGRWIGNGWLKYDISDGYQIGFDFHVEDYEGLKKIKKILESWGFYGSVYERPRKNLKQLVLYDKILFGFLKYVVPGYKGTQQTKHLPTWFRILPQDRLESLLDGLVQSGGLVEKLRFCVDTTSLRLAMELRELSLYLHIPSSLSVMESRFDESLKSWCLESYKIKFYPHRNNQCGRGIKRVREDGFYVRLTNVRKKHGSKVYDISVDKDFSYTTSEYAVHNSVGGCLVAYLLDIHGVDPFEYGLLFERFQNAEKKDLPDIDTDFMSAGRDQVEEYVRQKYGYDNCAQVSNLMTYTPKNVVDDVARSLRIGDNPQDSEKKNYFLIAKMIKDSIPDDADNFDEARKLSKKFGEFANKYPELVEYSERLLGKEKGYATHAAGMVVSDISISDFAPVRIDKNGIVAVQYEKNRCEDVGLVKMDFLGLSTLDVISESLKNIKRLGEDGPARMVDIPIDDQETYEMISRGETKCVFQLGKTTMMMALCKRIKPKNILDIAIVNALGRPSSGPRILDDGTTYDERTEYIGRRDGVNAVTYIHPSLKCLEETHGLCLMEEQLMGVAKNCAGWDLNKADKLRKFTKLKKKGAELAKQLEKDFIQGVMDTHMVSYEKAYEIWAKVVLPFQGYGFNKCLESFNFLLTEDGWKPLSELNPGQRVMSYENGNIYPSIIKEIGRTDRDMEVWEVVFRNGGKVRVTPNHKFLSTEGFLQISEIAERGLPIKIGSDTPNVVWEYSKHTPYGKKKERITALKKSGMSMSRISIMERESTKRLKRIIHGLPLNEKTTLVTKEWSDWNEFSAYWFGFILADGSVEKYKVTVELASYDMCHLMSLADFIGLENYAMRFRKCDGVRSRVVCLSIDSKTFVSSLRMLGIPKNKNNDSISIPDIPNRFFRNFVLGLFDGDGVVYEFKGKRAKFSLKNCLSVLLAVKEFLYLSIDGLSKNVNIRKDGNSYILIYQSKHDVKKIYDFLYDGATVFLPRKRIRIERWMAGKDDFHPRDLLWKKGMPEGYTEIKSVRPLPGIYPTYYVEMDGDPHNYIMDGGVVSANSHAVFYSINGYYTAYLKCHHPAAFLAAKLKIETMRNSITSEDEIEWAKQECRRASIKILPPDVNQSGAGYDVLDSGTIIMGLSAVKGLGIKAVEDIVSKQPFDSFVDFLNRTTARVVNKSKIEALAKAGCFGSFGLSRKFAFEEGKKTRDKLVRYLKKKEKDGYDAESAVMEFPFYPEQSEWGIKEMLEHERDVLGDCLSGSLNDLYDGFFTGISPVTMLSRIQFMPDRANLVVEVLVKSATREFTIKKKGRNHGKKMIKYAVEDIEGVSTELTVWPTQYALAKKLLSNNTPIRAHCQINDFNGQKTLMLVAFQEIYGVGNAKNS